MVVFPNAKINLGLSIIEKRPDGFHNLESCFYPVAWNDALEIIIADKLCFTNSGINIPSSGNDDNLCTKAYKALEKDFNLPPVHIHLHKNIPVGAGLGGGSSDAAFTIKLLNDLFKLGLTDDKMEAYVKPLGSDCAFFIRNQPVIAYEKGDRFQPVQLNLKGKHIMLVYPSIHISTKEAYAGLQPHKLKKSLKEILAEDIPVWKEQLKNDFEESILSKYPQIKIVKDILYHHGAVYASMTGSGSCVYGIFDKKPDSIIFKGDFNVMTSIL